MPVECKERHLDHIPKGSLPEEVEEENGDGNG